MLDKTVLSFLPNWVMGCRVTGVDLSYSCGTFMVSSFIPISKFFLKIEQAKKKLLTADVR